MFESVKLLIRSVFQSEIQNILFLSNTAQLQPLNYFHCSYISMFIVLWLFAHWWSILEIVQSGGFWLKRVDFLNNLLCIYPVLSTGFVQIWTESVQLVLASFRSWTLQHTYIFSDTRDSMVIHLEYGIDEFRPLLELVLCSQLQVISNGTVFNVCLLHHVLNKNKKFWFGRM